MSAEKINNSLEEDGVKKAQEAGRMVQRMQVRIKAWARER